MLSVNEMLQTTMGFKSLTCMTYVIDTTQGFIVNTGKRIKIQY